ncbi:MAG: metalloregulator ArsR/SmtB family transcription factor [Gemmatimonadales bacterium]|nr:metalloregulator ArsR/SmtB family transcription factor [Gemmatimonadales bacterium]
MSQRDFKDALYEQFARIGHAMSSPKRIELLELLGQGEKSVDALAAHADLPVKNTSAHLRVLRQARLVERRREGTYLYYRLADDKVIHFLKEMEELGRIRLAEVERVTNTYLRSRDELEPVTFGELRRLLKRAEITLIDVRPRDEYRAGHIPGAISVPVAELRDHLHKIPKGREVIAYCRGPYCVYSVEAMALLRRRGYRARRVENGIPEWRALGLAVAIGE